MDTIPPFSEFVQGSSLAAAFLIGALTFVDGLVLVGLVINGWGAFAVCVYCYANGYVTVPTMILSGFIGVFCGEQVSFVVGRLFGPGVLGLIARLAGLIERVKEKKLVGRLLFWISEASWQQSISRLTAAIHRWGGAALIVGRWTPVASVVPALCATLAMPYVRFTRFSAIACALWVVGWIAVVVVTVRGYATLMQLFD